MELRFSASYVELANTEQTITTKKCTLFAIAQNLVKVTAYDPDPYASCSLRIDLDGTSQSACDSTAFSSILNAEQSIVNWMVWENVAAGSRTLKCEWRTGSSNQNWTSKARNLTIIWWDVP